MSMKDAIITVLSFFFFMLFFIVALVLGATATPEASTTDIVYIVSSFIGMFVSFGVLMYQIAYVEY